MAIKISISITQNSQSVANNTSNVTVKVNASWTGGSFNRNQKPGHLVIDGTKYTFTSSFNESQTTTGSKTLFTKTVDVAHGSTGAKTLSCSASYTSGVSSGTVTASASKTLTTIARASVPTVSASSVDMGSAVTINTNRASSSFTHDLAYSFAGGSYVSIANGVGASYNWTTPDLASKIPNAASGTVTIRCITKSGSTTVGTKTVTMTLKVPASVVPTISAVSVAEAVAGLAAQFGVYVKTKSKIKATITAAGAKGSTIKSYSTTFNGRTYSGSTWTSAAITASGSLSLVTTVTDTRGRTAKKTTTITVWDYSPPVINALQVYRVNESGAADPDGIYIAVRYKYGFTSLAGKNPGSTVVEYKQSTATEWVPLEITPAAGSILDILLVVQSTALPKSPTFSTDYQYDVRMTVTDWFGASETYTATLETGAVILDISADGKGLGLFKVSEREGVDFGASAKGAVLGLWEATAEIPENGNMNDYLRPGVYSVPRNETMATITNRPCDRAGTLRVSSGIGTKKIAGAYAYIVQEFHPYHNTEPIYRRHLISNESGAFEPGPWRAITFRGQKVLWSGAMYMTAGHQVDLEEPVSAQDNGIVLVFSAYGSGAPVDNNFNLFFVPKKFVELLDGYGVAFQMNPVNFSAMGAKYLYIHDEYITGNASNDLSGTADTGISFNNAWYVLRYVLGV